LAHLLGVIENKHMKQSPFKFLSAHQKEDQAFFFGREVETKAPHELVLQSRPTLLLGLVNRRILQSEGDRYELAHDSLAAAIDRRRTAEERAIVEVSRMVREGLAAHQKTGGLMNAENLKYMQAFLPKLSLSEAEKDFLAKSESKIRANQRLRKMVIAGLTLLTIFAVGFGIYAFQQKNEADLSKEKAKKAQIEAGANLQKFKDEQKAKTELQIKELTEQAFRAENAREIEFACG